MREGPPGSLLHAGMPLRWRWAAWAGLVLTLASGTLLRYQWTGHAPVPLNARHLLHGHSHVALLGWAFIGVFGLMLRGAWGRPVGALRGLGEALLALLIVLMFVAFVLQGYAFWSILLSMLHIAVSFGLIARWVARGRGAAGAAARPWIELSLVWFVAGTVGPLMLSLGGTMGQGWIEAWVGYYLLLLFNGWLMFALIGFLAERLGAEPAGWTRGAMAVGVLPMALPQFEAWITVPAGDWVTLGGTLLFAAGLLGAGWRLGAAWRSGAGWRLGVGRRLGGRARVAGSVGPEPAGGALLLGALAALGLTAVIYAVGAAPGFADRFREVRALVVGLVHLQLLGFVTTALALLVLRPRPMGAALLLGGVWVTIGVLFWIGALELLGRPVMWSTQWVLTWAGLVALAGALWMAPRCTARPPFSNVGDEST
jgi:hypothetical protein